jgi:hypothetical protein
MKSTCSQFEVLDFERFYLGALIRDSIQPSKLLKPSDFLEPKHVDVYSAILAINLEGIACDEIVISNKLRLEDSKVAQHYINELVTDVGFATYNSVWEKVIHEKSELRRIERITKNIADIASKGEVSPDAIKASLRHSLEGLSSPLEVSPGVEDMPLGRLMNFKRETDPDCLIGRRWLCRKFSLLVVGQSGIGKSSLMLQMAISWTLGKSFFGIKSKEPKRTLIIQAENDLGDIAEAYQDVCAGFMDWTLEDQAILDNNLKIIRVVGKTGIHFAKTLKEEAEKHQADFVFVDPLLSYASGNVSSTEDMSLFLREQIAPVLAETGIVLVAMHHTGKPGNPDDKANQTVTDRSYDGIGSSEITNFFRSIAVISRAHAEQPIFRLRITKRLKRAGLSDSSGEMVDDVYLSHSRVSREIKWVYASPEQIKTLSEKKPKKKGY